MSDDGAAALHSGAGADALDAGFELLTDLAAPQERYNASSNSGGFLQPMDGMAMTFSRELTEYVLRHHELFSSTWRPRPRQCAAADPAQRRPAPALEVPASILDPLFAPKRMDEQEADITQRVNHFIDTFIDDGECNFTEDFAELFPSAVFLGLMGLAVGRARHVHPPARRHPAPGEVRSRWRRSTTEARLAGAARDGPGDLRVLRRPRSTSGRTAHRRHRSRISSTAEIDGEKLTSEEILDICFLFLIAGLDTVSDSLTCFYAFLASTPSTGS